MAIEKFDYPAMVQDALRGVVRRCLEIVVEQGLPGEHFFYVGFRTGHPQVRVPGFLRDQYPEEVTVVLQNQFWDLAVDESGFSVTLNFNASRHRLFVPFDALTAFVDPSAEFGLRFGPEPGAAERAPAPVSSKKGAAATPREKRVPAGERTGEVVRFDPSRRK